MYCSLPGSSVHGIFQAIVLEWIAISFSRGSSQPRDQTLVSHIAGGFFTSWATGQAENILDTSKLFQNSPNQASTICETVNFQMFKLVLEKAEEPEIKLPTSTGSSKKQESSRRTSISALLAMPKPLTVWITINCGKFWKRWEYQTTWPASWEICMQVRKQQLELDMEQQTGSK